MTNNDIEIQVNKNDRLALIIHSWLISKLRNYIYVIKF